MIDGGNYTPFFASEFKLFWKMKDILPYIMC